MTDHGVPAYNDTWVTLYKGDHFVLKGRLYNRGTRVALVVALGESNRGRFRSSKVVVSRNGLSFSDASGNDWQKDHAELCTLARKFNHLYPLHFMAKEWPRAGQT